MRVIVLHPYSKFEVRRFAPSEDTAHFFRLGINRPSDLDL